jgi:hypothetical protein
LPGILRAIFKQVGIAGNGDPSKIFTRIYCPNYRLQARRWLAMLENPTQIRGPFQIRFMARVNAQYILDQSGIGESAAVSPNS